MQSSISSSISFEAELVQLLRTMLQENPRQVIGIDGADGAGKSSLADLLGASLACRVIHGDSFIRNRGMPYPNILDLQSLKNEISAFTSLHKPVIVESVMLKLVLDALPAATTFDVYVRHSWPKGQLTKPELFDNVVDERDVIADDDLFCNHFSLPTLSIPRELIEYHKKWNPHIQADVVFEACFDPSHHG
ncbi:MAG: hypothetical protein ABIU96_15735 [Rhodanobacter sp.]